MLPAFAERFTLGMSRGPGFNLFPIPVSQSKAAGLVLGSGSPRVLLLIHFAHGSEPESETQSLTLQRPSCILLWEDSGEASGAEGRRGCGGPRTDILFNITCALPGSHMLRCNQMRLGSGVLLPHVITQRNRSRQ